MWGGSDTSVTSRLSAVEVRTAVAAARRDGRVEATRREIADRWADLAEMLALIDPRPSLIADACTVAERYALPALGAIHLAGALRLAEAPVVVASWDRRLRAAVLESGLGLAPATL